MGLLRTKPLSPAAEARRQAEIANEHQRQHDERIAYERDLTAQNARRRAQLWADQEREREDKRMAAFAQQQQEKRDREKREREQQRVRDEAKMTEYRDARAAFDSVKRELDALNAPHDLTSPEGRAAAVEQKLRQGALRELLAQADRRLILAERAVGRHRNGGI